MASPHRYAALLRGINVGGNRKVPMAQLREVLQGLGLEGCSTYLQSGNAVFTATDDPPLVRQQIEKALADTFGARIDVLIRTHEQIDHVIAHNPMPEQAATNGSRFFAVFTDGPLDQRALDVLHDYDFSPDHVVDGDHEVIYLWSPEGIGRSPAGRFAWDRKLGTICTTRNWNTVTKLHQLTHP